MRNYDEILYPPAGLDLSKATVEATRLTTLVELRGAQEIPVRSVYAARNYRP